MKRLVIAALSVFAFLPLSAGNEIPPAAKDVYLDLMEEAVHAYTPEHIEAYTRSVDEDGISEHGYARLASNIGILIAHGRLQDMKDTFVHMMDITVREIPLALEKNKSRKKPGEVGNDFAVKEVCCCIQEIEAAGILPKEKTDEWRASLSMMKPYDIYRVHPEPGEERAYNWCVFGATSECARIMTGMGGDQAYADLYLGDQLRFFDENGMYKDPNQPMVYDLVTRLQYMLALNLGYNGPARAEIEENLLKSAMLTLQLQSVSGEIPYGGRSNQFLLNEAFYAAVCEYYAGWMKEHGDLATASRFKAAAQRATASIGYWTAQKPVRHVKNRFPTETKYGCEKYAHFNKYMITMASWIYLAYRFADDSIPVSTEPEPASTFVTTPAFHRIMMNAGGYTIQFDVDADGHYDCNGIGRFQKAGACPVVAMSTPCSSGNPNFASDIKHIGPLSISPCWEKYEIASAEPGRVVLTDSLATWTTKLSKKGMKTILKKKGDIMMTLPAFEFDGESNTEILADEHTLTVRFKGWACTYRTNGKITPVEGTYFNRNGHFRRFDVKGRNRIRIKGSIHAI